MIELGVEAAVVGESQEEHGEDAEVSEDEYPDSRFSGEPGSLCRLRKQLR